MNRNRNQMFSRASSDMPFDNYRRQNFRNQQNSNSFDNEDYGQSFNQFNNFPGPFNSFDGPPSGFGNYNGNNFNTGSFPNMRYQNYNMRNGPFGNNFGGMNSPFNNSNQFPNMRNMGGRNMFLNKVNGPFKNQNFKNMKKKNFNIPNSELQASKMKTKPNNVLQVIKLNKKKKPIVKKLANGNSENNILTADKEPTNKMKGRMEFVMGNIIREFKKYHNDPIINNCLEIPFIQRVVKDIIRQRIVNVMMNKKIDNYTDTIDAYCKNYPYATDEEILNEVKADIYEGEHKFDIDTDEPKKFFRYNLLRLVDTRVDEMLEQLTLRFGNNEREILNLIDTLPDIEANENGENNESDDVLVPDSNESNAELKEEVANTESIEMTDEDKKKEEKLKTYMHVTDLLLKERLPKILTECKHKIIKVISGKDFKALQEQILVETKDLIARNHQKLMENLKEEQKQDSEKIPPYYVKVHGEPKLPTKDEFRDFIKQYNPKFVKKHRTNDNLVVVTFDKIEEYNKLLADKEYIVGGVTLIFEPTTPEHALSDLENQTCAVNVEENGEDHEEMDTGELEL